MIGINQISRDTKFIVMSWTIIKSLAVKFVSSANVAMIPQLLTRILYYSSFGFRISSNQ